MSRYHDAQSWANHSHRLRPIITASLPQPCVSTRCRYGGVVYPGDRFDVAHRIAASDGGQPTVENTGPAHPRCNRSDGARLGNRINKQTERERKRLPSW